MEEVNILKEMPPRNPIDGTFELTVRCNLHCKMCLFRHDDCENAEIMKNELTAEQWIDMARQVAEAGTMKLLITGGEPMLRPDFCEIWEGIYKQGFIMELYTNATMVNSNIMETLNKYPPHIIGITVYGSNSDVYGKVTGSKKAFEDMCTGVQRLMSLPSIIKFRSTVIKDNFHDINNIDKMIAEKFKWNGIIQEPRSVLLPVRGGSSKAREVRLSPEDNVKLIFRRGIDYMKNVVGEREFDINNIRIRCVPKECENKKNISTEYTLLGCDAGMNSYTISWAGELLGCQNLGVFHTNALKCGFKTAWDKFPFEVKLPPINNRCMDCKVSRYCETCYATRFSETGSFDGYPEYQCKDAHEFARLINGGKYNEEI